ncbi:MAG: GntR family transcriptional regulator, partial [Burkholderiales bacterium]
MVRPSGLCWGRIGGAEPRSRKKDLHLDALSTAEIRPLSRHGQSLSVLLAAHFEGLIATGEIAPGTKLPSERELATSMSVSRSSLREAMHELESKHLISRVQGRGTVVLGPMAGVEKLLAMSAGDTDQKYAAELRAILEPSVASLAAYRATPASLLQLRDVLDKSHENLLQAESLRLDVEFHLLLARAAQNPLLTALHTMASDWTSEVRQHSHTTKEARRISVVGHRVIFDAVAA